MIEQWRQVPGCVGYEVSDLGNVRSYRKGKAARSLVQHQKRGYLTVLLTTSNGRIYPSVHRLVLLSFVGPCPEGMQGCHENGVRTDNRLANLRWDTTDANVDDRIAHGTAAKGARNGSKTHPESVLKGSQNGTAKLNETTAALVRARAAAGETNTSLAAEFGVSKNAIGYCVNRKTWRHV